MRLLRCAVGHGFVVGVKMRIIVYDEIRWVERLCDLDEAHEYVSGFCSHALVNEVM